MHKKLQIIIFTFLLLGIYDIEAKALQFKDENLEPGEKLNPIRLHEVIKHSELHWDAILTSDWSNGFASQRGSLNNGYRGILDYRVEGHLELYNLAGHSGRLVTRVTGTGFVDENITNFFDDPLIDLPELYFENDKEIGDNELSLNFGKFAIRRFFGKDEINSDPFDIGEMRFAGAVANTLNILNSINEFRDADLRLSGARYATGSYGFRLAAKNQNMERGFWKRWGYQQMFAVSQLNRFAHNFFGISEINKNWGKNYPGKFSTGLLYANDEVFRVPNLGRNSYLLYASLAHKLHERFSYYFRYGSLFRTIGSEESTLNEYRIGLYTKFTERLGAHFWLGYFDGSSKLGENDNAILWTNVFRYKLTENLAAFFTAALRFNQFSSAAADLDDSNYTIALQLQYAR